MGLLAERWSRAWCTPLGNRPSNAAHDGWRPWHEAACLTAGPPGIEESLSEAPAALTGVQRAA